MTLKKDGENTLKSELASWPDGIKARKENRFTTAWRTIQIAPQAVGLINSSLILNLNEPCKLDTTDWIKPIKYVGVWWDASGSGNLEDGRSAWRYNRQCQEIH